MKILFKFLCLICIILQYNIIVTINLVFSEPISRVTHLRGLEESVNVPTTIPPTGANPTTVPPSGANPTTIPPTGNNPTTIPPTGVNLTTVPPTGNNPTTIPPTGVNPTTIPPTGNNPTTVSPTGVNPTTIPPTGNNPTTVSPSGNNPTTIPPTGNNPTTVSPSGNNPTTIPPTGNNNRKEEDKENDDDDDDEKLKKETTSLPTNNSTGLITLQNNNVNNNNNLNNNNLNNANNNNNMNNNINNNNLNNNNLNNNNNVNNNNNLNNNNLNNNNNMNNNINNNANNNLNNNNNVNNMNNNVNNNNLNNNVNDNNNLNNNLNNNNNANNNLINNNNNNNLSNNNNQLINQVDNQNNNQNNNNQNNNQNNNNQVNNQNNNNQVNNQVNNQNNNQNNNINFNNNNNINLPTSLFPSSSSSSSSSTPSPTTPAPSSSSTPLPSSPTTPSPSSSSSSTDSLATITDNGRKSTFGTVKIKSPKSGKGHCIASAEGETKPDNERIKSEGVNSEIKENDSGEIKITDLEVSKKYTVYCIYEADGVSTVQQFNPIEWSAGESYTISNPKVEWNGNYSLKVTVESSHPSTIKCVLANTDVEENNYPITEIENSPFSGEVKEKNSSAEIIIKIQAVKDFNSRRVICIGNKEGDVKPRTSVIYKMNEPIVTIGQLPTKGDTKISKVTIPLTCTAPAKGMCQVKFPHSTLQLEDLLKEGKKYECSNTISIEFDVKPCREYVIECISFDNEEKPHNVIESKRFGLCDSVIEEGYTIGVGEIIGISFVVGCILMCGLFAYRKLITPETSDANEIMGGLFDSEEDDNLYRQIKPSIESNLPPPTEYVPPQPINSLQKKKVKKSHNKPKIKKDENQEAQNNFFAELGMETKM